MRVKKREVHWRKKVLLILILLALLSLCFKLALLLGTQLEVQRQAIEHLQTQLQANAVTIADLKVQAASQAHVIGQLQDKIMHITQTSTGYSVKVAQPQPHTVLTPQAQKVAEAGILGGAAALAGRALMGLWEAVAPIL